MLNWIVGFCHKAAENTRPREKTPRSIRASNLGFRGGSSVLQPRCYRCCCVGNLIVYLILPPQPRVDPEHLLFPAAAQDIFPCPITPCDSAESIYMIPTMGSSPSFFLRSLAIQFPRWPETHFTCLWLNKKAVPRPCYHLTITQSSILFW